MDFDKLEIKIEADSTKATSNVDQLGKSLRDLNTDLKNLNTTSLISLSAGVKQLSDSMSLLSPMMKGKGNDFTTLSTRLSALANNTNPKALTMLGQSVRLLGSSLQTMSSASGSTVALSSLAKSLSSLGYDSTTRAIANLPLLTRELANMITTLSKLPVVNGNIQKLIASIAALSKQGAKVGSAGRSMASNFNSTGLSLKNLRFRFLNISRIIGTVYANIWLLIRAVKSLSGAVRSAMGYGETLNYFEKAFDDIAMRSTKDWSELGYESATEYYKALSDTLKKEAMGINEQLTGMTNNGKGYKVSSGKNLGLNTTDTLKAQTKFAQMSASMGVATENATMLSNVMTKLGGDLASLYDTDFNTVWGNLQSGITGMSRTMDKYGVNIRNANLNQELMNLGINTTVDKLGQEDKVLLRTIVMLRGTTAAWGDLAETQDSSANQLRILQSNWQKLSSIIGSMFIPVLKAVLPIANAVLVALQRLAAFVANLFGIDADFGSTIGSGVDDMSDYFDDMADSAGGASGAVKKLKNQLLGIDELNVISTPDDGGGAGGAGGGSLGKLNEAFKDAVDDYLAEWQKAFDNMEDKITSMANAIENSKAFQTLKDLFVNLKDGNWEVVGKDVSELFIITTDTISKALESVDWTQVGINVGEFLAGIEYGKIAISVGKLIWNILKAIIETYGGLFWTTFFENPLGWGNLAPKLGALVAKYVAAPLSKWIKDHVSPVVKWIEDRWIDIVDFFNPGNITEKLEQIETFVRETLIPKMTTEWLDLWVGMGKKAGEKVAEIIQKLKDNFSNSNIKAKIDGLSSGFLAKITEAKTNVTNKASEIITTLTSKFSAVNIGNAIGGIKQAFTNAVNDAKRVVETIITNIVNFINNKFGSSSNFTVSGLLNALTSPLTKALEYLNDIISKINQINGMSINVGASNVIDLGANIINAVADVVKEETKKTPTSTKKDPGDYINKASGSTAGMPSYAKRFADGGFPTVGTYFWAGEAGPEMLGTVGGKTAVASGSEITGISDTIRSTSSQEMDLLRQQNELLMAIVNKPFGISESEIFNSVRNSASNYTRTTGRLAF